MPWQLQSLEALASSPTVDADQAEQGSLQISKFLTEAPTDFIEPLMGSPFGRVYKLFLERCCTARFNSGNAEKRREELSQKLREVGCDTPEGWVVRLFPFSLPIRSKLTMQRPNCLMASHPLFSPLRSIGNNTRSQPQLTTHLKTESLNRILGLSNLYYIDPEDQEILKELREVRLQTTELMLSVGREELARQFQADFGDRFWAMAQSGVQKENLDAKEVEQRDAMQQWLSQTPNSLHQEGGIQRFAAVLLFNPPGSVRLADPDSNLPSWFTDGYKRYCSMAQV